jgi:hypothetical protein
MTNLQQGVDTFTQWNHPDTCPSEAGEYRATLVPGSLDTPARRWWNGQYWSNPYLVNWSEDLQKQAREQPSLFRMFWVKDALPETETVH